MMYQIAYNGEFIYGTDEEKTVLNPSLEVELNSAGSLTITIPVENESWSQFEVFRGEVVVYEGDDAIWFGRPLQIVRDWMNRKVVTCEGALAYFNDSLQVTKEYKQAQTPLYTDTNVYPGKTGFINDIIGLHNDQVEADRKIYIGEIDVDNELVYRYVDYETTADILQRMCLDTNGGYFILRKGLNGNDETVNFLDWRKEMPYSTDQPVQFGLNLLDLNQDLNGADICTVLLPTGENDLNISTVQVYSEDDPNHPPYHINDPEGDVLHGSGSVYMTHMQGYKRFGRVVKTKDFNSIADKNSLFQKAAEWLNEQNTDVTTIECSVADLHYLNEYSDYGKLRIGQLVQVGSTPHDLSKELPIYKVSMKLDSGAKTITLGTPPKRELTDIVKSNGGSTRGSSGATGTGGGSDSSGGGSSSTYVPVTDVKVKMPGSNTFGTVVQKRIAKIDLSHLGEGTITDVQLNGESVVDDGVANIELGHYMTTEDGNLTIRQYYNDADSYDYVVNIEAMVRSSDPLRYESRVTVIKSLDGTEISRTVFGYGTYNYPNPYIVIDDVLSLGYNLYPEFYSQDVHWTLEWLKNGENHNSGYLVGWYDSYNGSYSDTFITQEQSLYDIMLRKDVSNDVIDVRVDGQSVVNENKIANITMPTIPVTDVKLDHDSVVDENGVANLPRYPSIVGNYTGTGSEQGDLTRLAIGNLIYDVSCVKANPSGTPTDDLNTIQIGNDIFNIAGSGGSGGTGGQYTCDLLFVNDPLPTPASGKTDVDKTYTLSHSIDAYDAVYVISYMYYYSSNKSQLCSQTIFKKDYYERGLDNNAFLLNGTLENGNRRLFFSFTDDTHIFTRANRSANNEEPILYKVYGIKFNANIFSPEIYSEEEREVGVWIDGRPLYKRTIEGLAVTCNTGAWTNILKISDYFDDDLSYIHITDIIWDTGDAVGGNHRNIGYHQAYNGYIRYWPLQYADTINRITLLYTKTNDTPGSAHWLPGGTITVNYSTDEQIVGLWNGQTLYQKMFDLGQDITISSSSWTDTSILNTFNIDKIIAVHAMASDGTCRSVAATVKTSNYIALQIAENAQRYVRYFVLQYTKTTDTPGSASPTILATQAELEAMADHFQDGVDSVYDACVAKGSTPASHALSDVVDGIMAIETSIVGGKTITRNGTYNAADDGLDGYNTVKVQVSSGSGDLIEFSSETGVNQLDEVTADSVLDLNSIIFTSEAGGV